MDTNARMMLTPASQVELDTSVLYSPKDVALHAAAACDVGDCPERPIFLRGTD